MRTEWMLARRPEGDNWIKRDARTERTDDEFLRLRESWCQLIEDQGMQYKFVSYDQLENNELLKGGYRVFILPDRVRYRSRKLMRFVIPIARRDRHCGWRTWNLQRT